MKPLNSHKTLSDKIHRVIISVILTQMISIALLLNRASADDAKKILSHRPMSLRSIYLMTAISILLRFM